MRNRIYKVVCTLRRNAKSEGMYEFFDNAKADMDINFHPEHGYAKLIFGGMLACLN